MFNPMGSSNPQDLGNGGTVDGDLIITGDLSVSGGISLTLSEVIQGTSTIDITDTEAFLVRKNGDGGDVFVVDTTNSRVGIGGTPDKALTISSANAQLHIKESDAGTNLKNWLFNAEGGVLYYQTLTDAIGGGSTYMQVNRTEATTTSVSFPTGNIGIGTTSPLQSIDNVGKVIIADNKSDDTAKVFGILGHQYDSGTETEGYGLVMGYSTNSMNRVQIGGGNSDHNSATLIKFFTGANTTTRTGTERMSIDSSGAVNVTGTLTAGSGSKITSSSADTTFTVETTSGSTIFPIIDLVSSHSSVGGKIRQGGTDVISLDKSQNATFGGNIEILKGTPTLILKQNDTSSSQIEMKNSGGSIVGRIKYDTAGSNHMYIENRNAGNLVLETNDTARLTIDGSGNVGIGLTDPSKALEIAGNGAEAELVYLTSTQSANTSNRVRLSHRLLTDSQERTSFSLLSGFNTITDGSRNSIVEFKTSNAGTFGTAMTIDGGNVGIGISPVFNSLHIHKSNSDYNYLHITNTTTGTTHDDGLLFGFESDEHAYIVNRENTNLNFFTNNTQRMQISATGNVGIGTTSPSVALDISGQFQAITNTDSATAGVIRNTHATGYGLKINGASDSTRYALTVNDNDDDTTFFRVLGNGKVEVSDTAEDVVSLEVGGAIESSAGLSTFGSAVTILNKRNSADQHGLVVGAKNSSSFPLIVGRHDSTFNDLVVSGSGNVGIGVIPEVTESSYDSLQIGGNANITSYATQGAGGQVDYGHNFYYAPSGQDKYISADEASQLRQGSGAFTFRSAASGSADAVITFTSIAKFDINSRISLSNNDGNTDNTVLGYNALTNNGTVLGDVGCDRNIAVGDLAMGTGTKTTAVNNIAVGASSLTDITSGTSNVAVGSFSAPNITSGTGNIAIGTESIHTATTANNIIAIGTTAGFAISANSTAADGSIAIGHNALSSLTNGAGNTAIGYKSISEIVDGNRNTAVGYGSMQNSVGGTTSDGSSDNTFIGYLSGGGQWLNSTSAGNTAVGSKTAMSDSWNGASYSSLFGYQAGKDITTGSRNTLIGYACGDSITTGTTNTGLGAEASFDIDANNQIAIGYQASTTSTGANTVVLGNASVTDVYMAQDSQAYVHAQNVPNHVANTMSSPYYRFDGVNDVITVTEATQTPHLELGTGDFSFEMLVRAEEWTSLNYIFGKFEDGNNYYALHTDSNDFLNFYAIDGGSAKINLVATATGGLTDGQWAHIAVVADRSGSGQFYVNGNAIGTTTSVMNANAVEQNADFTFARLDTNYGELEMSHFRHFNKALTATEVRGMYSGVSVPFKYKGSNQTNLISSAFTNLSSTYESFSGASASGFTASNSSGNAYAESADEISLQEGKSYVINFNAAITSGTYPTVSVLYFSGGNHATLGSVEYQVVAGANSFVFTSIVTTNTLIRFTNAGTTNDTLVISGLTVTRAGAVAEYDGSGIASDKWLDKSGNDLHGTVSGATVENAPTDDDGLVYEEGTYTITLGNGGTGATFSTSTNVGSYTRIGKIVHVNARVISSENFSGSDGYLYMSLPFGHQANEFFRVIVYYNNLGTAGDLVVGVPATSSSGGTQLAFQYLTKNAAPTTINSSALSSGDEISFQVTYRIA